MAEKCFWVHYEGVMQARGQQKTGRGGRARGRRGTGTAFQHADVNIYCAEIQDGCRH
jgi:hypothetical protein